MKTKLKRFLCVFLTAALMLALPGMQTVEAASYAGTTIRLEKTEGTVTVKNAAGKEISLDEGGKLLNGYVVTTADKSYAWISLDDKKVLKLDAASSVELEKNKKKLTISLNAGKLFFDVKAKLTINEEMVVKSSTLVTGIRGTSGLLESDNSGEAKSSGLQVYDGTVAASALTIDPKSGKPQAAAPLSVEAGNGVSVSSDSTEAPQVAEISASDIPGFAAVAIKEDPALQARIEESSNLNVQEIVDSADEKLAADEKAAEEKKESLEQAKEAEIAEDKAANESEAAEAGESAEGENSENAAAENNTESSSNAGSTYVPGNSGGGWYVPENNTQNTGRALRSGEMYIDSEEALRQAGGSNSNSRYYTCRQFVLKNDIEITGDSVYVERDIVLDLNGHKITLNNATSAGITVGSQGYLTIAYTSQRYVGEIVAGTGFGGNALGHGLVDVQGGFQMYRGRLTAVRSSSSSEALLGIVVCDGGNVFLQNATVTAEGYAISERVTDPFAYRQITVSRDAVVKSTSDYAIAQTSYSDLSISGYVEGAAGALYLQDGRTSVLEGATLKTDGSVYKGNVKDSDGNDINSLVVISSLNYDAVLDVYGGRLVYPTKARFYPFVLVEGNNTSHHAKIFAETPSSISYVHANSTSNGFMIDNATPSNPYHLTAYVNDPDDFKNALSANTSYKRVVLTDSFNINGKSVTVDKSVSLNLNGKTITANNRDDGNISITSVGYLGIYDTSESRDGCIYAELDRGVNCDSGLIEVNGAFAIYDGIIDAKRDGSRDHGQRAIVIKERGTAYLLGGTVTAGLFAVSEEDIRSYNYTYTAVTIGGDVNIKSTTDYAVYKQSGSNYKIGDHYEDGVSNPVIEGACGALYVENGTVDVSYGASLKTSNSGHTSLNTTAGIDIPNSLITVNPKNGDATVNINSNEITFDYPSGLTHPFVQVSNNGSHTGAIAVMLNGITQQPIIDLPISNATVSTTGAITITPSAP